MPVPTFIQVPAYQVKPSDDILIDEDAKEPDANGQPQQISHVDVGDKWVHVNLVTPIKRKRVFRFEYFDQVNIIRLEDTPEDILARKARSLAGMALRAQRDYWRTRNTLAAELTPGVKERRRYYWQGDETLLEPTGSARSVAQAAAEMAKEEGVLEGWRQAELHLAQNPEAGLVAAVVAAVEGVKEVLINGSHGDPAEYEDGLRWFIRRAEREVA